MSPEFTKRSLNLNYLLIPDRGGSFGGTSAGPNFKEIYPLSDIQLVELKRSGVQVFKVFEHSEFSDLEPFFKTVVKLVPALQAEIEKLPSTVSIYDGAMILNGLLARIAFPNNRAIVINHEMHGAQGMDGIINPATWKKHRYLGETIYAADIQLVEAGPNVIGFSTKEYGFCDPGAAYSDSINAYKFFIEAAKVSADPLPHTIGNLLMHFNVTQDQYCSDFGVLRNRLHELCHAEDRVFFNKFLKNPSEFGDRATVLLSERSPMYEPFLRLEKGSHSYHNFSTDLVEISALVRGVQAEINHHLAEKAPHKAIIAFCDFIALQGISSEMYIAGAEGYNKPGAGVILLFSHELSANADAESIVRNTLLSLSTEEAAKRVKAVTDTVVNTNFKGYMQRARECGLKPPKKR